VSTRSRASGRCPQPPRCGSLQRPDHRPAGLFFWETFSRAENAEARSRISTSISSTRFRRRSSTSSACSSRPCGPHRHQPGPSTGAVTTRSCLGRRRSSRSDTRRNGLAPQHDAESTAAPQQASGHSLGGDSCLRSDAQQAGQAPLACNGFRSDVVFRPQRALFAGQPGEPKVS
jgi:hypothetical protein